MDWKQIKARTERQFESTVIHQNVWGYQIQKNTRWNPGLNQIEIKALENLFKLRFPTDYTEMLSHINGFDTPQISIDPDGLREDQFTNQCYQYPKDYETSKWLVNEVQQNLSYAYQALEEAGFDTADIEGFIPLYSHRALVVFKNKALSPVLSIWGKDIILYGKSLSDYWCNEFNIENQ